ncbi:hypothetical protein [Haloferax elongans]|uniref:hypothetical protein n=1 Tax=Haloferax elongans TaxID=403191 RepID=UPI0012673707|nr:hypothetical protein [Haloferax elongans]
MTDEEFEQMDEKLAEFFDKVRAAMDAAIQADLEEMECPEMLKDKKSDPTFRPVTEEEFEQMDEKIAVFFDEARAKMDAAVQADLDAMEDESKDLE